ncbi:MAG: aa3-type cytochrome c oxidase subunit IV [Alphaproteobacteria bacterium]|nr:aa3-type cytochrome c oxidase subunit IV [Alphaproteobacteria bacterium]
MADLDNKPGATQGTMDLTEHKKTFGGFIRFSTWVVVLSLIVLVFLALSNA